MQRSSSSADAARAMLRDLVEADDLARRLAATAPLAVAAAGGAQTLVAQWGHPSGAWFWSISPVQDSLWEAMADEHQQPSRANQGSSEYI